MEQLQKRTALRKTFLKETFEKIITSLFPLREVKLNYVLVPAPETTSLQCLLISVFKAPE